MVTSPACIRPRIHILDCIDTLMPRIVCRTTSGEASSIAVGSCGVKDLGSLCMPALRFGRIRETKLLHARGRRSVNDNLQLEISQTESASTCERVSCRSIFGFIVDFFATTTHTPPTSEFALDSMYSLTMATYLPKSSPTVDSE